jgi:hypothetical protein
MTFFAAHLSYSVTLFLKLFLVLAPSNFSSDTFMLVLLSVLNPRLFFFSLLALSLNFLRLNVYPFQHMNSISCNLLHAATLQNKTQITSTGI